MSYYDTRQALLTKLLAASIVPDTDIAFENDEKDPTGKDIWLAVYFLPANSGIMGKTSVSRNEQRGIFQISVFVRKNSDHFDNEQLEKIDEILTEFAYGTSAVFNSQNVDILDSTVTNRRHDSSWYVRDISIDYLAFTTR